MNTKHMRISLLGAAVVLLPLALGAQVDPNANTGGMSNSAPFPQPTSVPIGQPGSTTANGTATSMQDSLGAPGETGQQMLDKQFLRAAIEGGIGDMKIGTLAQEKGGPDVKPLAQTMVDDHTATNKDLSAVADSLGVMLPKKMSKQDQAEYNKLNSLSGKDFDTEYVIFLAKSHRQALHSFYMEASAAADPGLQSQVVKTLMVMHQHIGLISKVAKEDGITLPPRPPRPPRPNATTAAK